MMNQFKIECSRITPDGVCAVVAVGNPRAFLMKGGSMLTHESIKWNGRIPWPFLQSSLHFVVNGTTGSPLTEAGFWRAWAVWR